MAATSTTSAIPAPPHAKYRSGDVTSPTTAAHNEALLDSVVLAAAGDMSLHESMVRDVDAGDLQIPNTLGKMRRWVCDLERDLAVMGEELHHLGSRTVLRTQSAQEVTHARQQLCDDIGLDRERLSTLQSAITTIHTLVTYIRYSDQERVDARRSSAARHRATLAARDERIAELKAQLQAAQRQASAPAPAVPRPVATKAPASASTPAPAMALRSPFRVGYRLPRQPAEALRLHDVGGKRLPGAAKQAAPPSPQHQQQAQQQQQQRRHNAPQLRPRSSGPAFTVSSSTLLATSATTTTRRGPPISRPLTASSMPRASSRPASPTLQGLPPDTSPRRRPPSSVAGERSVESTPRGGTPVQEPTPVRLASNEQAPAGASPSPSPSPSPDPEAEEAALLEQQHRQRHVGGVAVLEDFYAAAAARRRSRGATAPKEAVTRRRAGQQQAMEVPSWQAKYKLGDAGRRPRVQTAPQGATRGSSSSSSKRRAGGGGGGGGGSSSAPRHASVSSVSAWRTAGTTPMPATPQQQQQQQQQHHQQQQHSPPPWWPPTRSVATSAAATSESRELEPEGMTSGYGYMDESGVDVVEGDADPAVPAHLLGFLEDASLPHAPSAPLQRPVSAPAGARRPQHRHHQPQLQPQQLSPPPPSLRVPSVATASPYSEYPAVLGSWSSTHPMSPHAHHGSTSTSGGYELMGTAAFPSDSPTHHHRHRHHNNNSSSSTRPLSSAPMTRPSTGVRLPSTLAAKKSTRRSTSKHHRT